MNRISLLLLFCFLVKNSFACLNGETKVLKNGFFIYEDAESNVPYGHRFEIPKGNALVNELDSFYRTTNDLSYLSDIGYVYIVQGRYKEAVEIYLRIEAKAPNRYSTASNIGTAYELMGENEKALNWIKKSIKINAAAHNKSEWLHVKILEAKLKGADFVDTVSSRFFINTSFGKADNPRSDLSVGDLRELMDALYYQLHERMSFIKGEDRIIAMLLFELGNAFVDRDLSKEPQHEELTTYKLAKEYGFDNAIIDRRIAFVEKANERKKQLIERAKQKELEAKQIYQRKKQLIYYTIYGAIGGCFIIVLLLIKKRMR